MSLTKVTYSMTAGSPVNVLDYGADPTGIADSFDAMLAAWNYCQPLGKNLYFPAGTYDVRGERSFPFNQGSGIVTVLLDCNNMTIFGDGPSTILKTTSVNGADVFQLNGLKNFHVRNLQVQSVVSGSDAGSNGMSVTGGFDNITVDNFWAYNLGYVDKTTYVDGGKAVSIQPPGDADPILIGSFKATNIYADGCVYGFGYEPDNDLALTQPVSIEVDIVVSNCRQGVVLSAPAATGALAANSTSGVRIRGQSINCMQDIVCGRTFGVDIDMQIIQTKTAAQLLLSYEGTQWTSVDGVADVIGVICTYAKNSRFNVQGNKLSCHNKARIGGANDPSTGIAGTTAYCDFYLDISGVSAAADVLGVDAGGNSMTDSRIYATTSTTVSLPAIFYTPSYNNTLTVGPATVIKSIAVSDTIGWTESDGVTVNRFKYVQSGILSTQQIGASAAGTLVEQWLDHTGIAQVAWRDDGNLAVNTKIAASAVATINGVQAVYNLSGALLGYIPVYTTYTP